MPTGNPPLTVACYCATFLKPEMQHIYRQLTAVRRFEVAVFTQKRENAAAFPFDDVTRVPRSPFRWLRRILVKQWLGRPLQFSRYEAGCLRRRLRARRCALLHIFFGNTGVQLLPFLADRRRRLPAVVSFHGADVLVELGRPAHRRAVAELFGQVELVLARSRSLLDALASLGCPREKLRLNRTGIPLEGFPYRERTVPSGGAFRFLQACRLIQKKGLPTTQRDFARFAREHKGARFTIAGEGPQEAELRALGAELGVADRVEFAGFLSQDALRRRLYEAHFFLHPSELGPDGNQEGIPNALLEAMSTGLPVFATTHGGIPEAVEHGAAGWLVPERADEALGEALCQLAGDPARLAAMGRAASRAVEENFSLAAQARKLEEYYQEAMNGPA